jgi:hypothetical protein
MSRGGGHSTDLTNHRPPAAPESLITELSQHAPWGQEGPRGPPCALRSARVCVYALLLGGSLPTTNTHPAALLCIVSCVGVPIWHLTSDI